MRDARRKPVAAAVLLVLAHCGGDAFADTVIVDSCDDPPFPLFETPLRLAISNAANGDTIDLSGLACSTTRPSARCVRVALTQSSTNLAGSALPDQATIVRRHRDVVDQHEPGRLRQSIHVLEVADAHMRNALSQ